MDGMKTSDTGDTDGDDSSPKIPFLDFGRAALRRREVGRGCIFIRLVHVNPCARFEEWDADLRDVQDVQDKTLDTDDTDCTDGADQFLT
jgi:hypothetical protein